MSIELVMPSNYLILCHLLLLPSVFPSIRVFSNESALRIRWPKCWSFSFNINPSNQYSELISFRIAWFDLLAIQGALKSLLQHHSLKGAQTWHSAFFMVQLSYPYWKNHSFDYIDLFWQSDVSASQYAKFIVAFLPSSNRLLILWLQSLSIVILEPKKIKSVIVFIFFPIYLP